MSSFRELNLQYRYRSGSQDALPIQFYEMVMPCSVKYYRAVGFFTSRCFIEISHGIKDFIKNDGKMYLITSPKLNAEDYDAIKNGYKAREQVYLEAFKREMIIPEDFNDCERLKFLANLIKNGYLEIKIAVTKKDTNSMYHEKIGIFEDLFGDKIVISGSNNESENAITNNFESFDVFTSWKDTERVEVRCEDFDNMWLDIQPGLDVIDFPDFNKLFLNTYLGDAATTSSLSLKYNLFNKPNDLVLYDYQENAIEEWKKHKYIGIYDMATGTGKTFTALASIDKLRNEVNGNVCVIILCPYIHLVTQWVVDIKKFNCKPIIGFGSSPQKNWKDLLARKISNRNRVDGDDGFFCFISTVATFKSSYVQTQIHRIRKPILLVADEAHNLGAQNAKTFLEPDIYKYRLALSATLERHFDKSGTKSLFDFFGVKCIEYGLEEAIREHHLVPYKYYPIVVTFDEDEREKYNDLTKSISKEILKDKKTGKTKISEKGKLLCICRSRIIAGCHQKIPMLMEKLKSYKDDNSILIYCGAVNYYEDCFLDDDEDEVDLIDKQIDEVIRRVRDDYDMSITRFTAEVTINEREKIKEDFSEGENLQIIAAIKCLDEGVNIPTIKTAFILASSTNPKEYIQRRGRVLRKAPNKEFAEIYDFITLPYGFDNDVYKADSELLGFKTLAKNELERIKEFSRLSMNSEDSLRLLEWIPKTYQLNVKNYMEDFIYE